jgi:hypothetical protein
MLEAQGHIRDENSPGITPVGFSTQTDTASRSCGFKSPMHPETKVTAE